MNSKDKAVCCVCGNETEFLKRRNVSVSNEVEVKPRHGINANKRTMRKESSWYVCSSCWDRYDVAVRIAGIMDGLR